MLPPRKQHHPHPWEQREMQLRALHGPQVMIKTSPFRSLHVPEVIWVFYLPTNRLKCGWGRILRMISLLLQHRSWFLTSGNLHGLKPTGKSDRSLSITDTQQQQQGTITRSTDRQEHFSRDLYSRKKKIQLLYLHSCCPPLFLSLSNYINTNTYKARPISVKIQLYFF